MKQTLTKTLALCVLLTLSAQAEMKCEAGKCSTGKETTPKVAPKAEEAPRNAGGMTEKEHAVMLKKEEEAKASTKMSPEAHAKMLKEEEAAKNTPEKIKDRKNRRVLNSFLM